MIHASVGSSGVFIVIDERLTRMTTRTLILTRIRRMIKDIGRLDSKYADCVRVHDKKSKQETGLHSQFTLSLTHTHIHISA